MAKHPALKLSAALARTISAFTSCLPKREPGGEGSISYGGSVVELGMIGLGHMGGNMAQQLLRGGHRVVTYDQSREAVVASESRGAVGASSLEDLVGRLAQQRAEPRCPELPKATRCSRTTGSGTWV
jgi:phosphoglycerate dehydrogenase-like enzyme